MDYEEDTKHGASPWNVYRLTIHLLEKAKKNEKGKIILEGNDLNIVELMGRMVSFSEDNLKHSFVLNDETGTIEIIQYLSDISTLPNQKKFSYVKNGMAKVIGVPKIEHNTLSITAISIKNVNTLVEYDHFISLVIAGYSCKSLISHPEAFLHNFEKGDKKESKDIGGMNSNENKLTINEAKVLAAITDISKIQVDISREDIYEALGDKLSNLEFIKILKSLLAKSKIKTTSDEAHFQVI